MAYRHLIMDERNVLWQMKLLGKDQAEIAKCLGRNRSTISRECEFRLVAGPTCRVSSPSPWNLFRGPPDTQPLCGLPAWISNEADGTSGT
jgi:hypothetical protein